MTTLNPLWTVGEVIGQLCSSGARWLATVPALAGTAEPAAGDGQEIIVVGNEQIPETLPYSALLASSASPGPAIHPGTAHVALPYSGGTTGLSKGVMLRHRNQLASLAAADADLSSLRWIMSAAAPLDVGTASACARRVGCRVFQG